MHQGAMRPEMGCGHVGRPTVRSAGPGWGQKHTKGLHELCTSLGHCQLFNISMKRTNIEAQFKGVEAPSC